MALAMYKQVNPLEVPFTFEEEVSLCQHEGCTEKGTHALSNTSSEVFCQDHAPSGEVCSHVYTSSSQVYTMVPSGTTRQTHPPFESHAS